MMAISQAIAAAKRMVRLNAEMMDAVVFGPEAHTGSPVP